MDSRLLAVLADPTSHAPLSLDDARHAADGRIESGTLTTDGRSYPIRSGIPRMVVTEDSGQCQTQESFGFKWQQVHTYDRPEVISTHRNWIVERYGFGSEAAMTDYFASRRRILDAGCGSGFSSSTWLNPESDTRMSGQWVGLDISAAIDVAQRRLGSCACADFVQGDVLEPPFQDGAFDTIFSEGVLHHTPSTRKAIHAMSRVLAPGGEFLFYVYRRKGPIREFSDDHIRDLVADMPGDQAWEFLKPLTKLGQALAEMKATVDVPEDIPWLGVKAGKQDIQRLIYWNVAKMFWNSDYSFDENHHINFDWYHPRYAHRQSREEVTRWCGEAGLKIVRLSEQESGLTVVATK